MKKFLTTEDRKRLCERAKMAAGSTFDFSEHEEAIEKDIAAERAFAGKLAAQIESEGCRVSVFANIIYIVIADDAYALSVDKINCRQIPVQTE